MNTEYFQRKRSRYVISREPCRSYFRTPRTPADSNKVVRSVIVYVFDLLQSNTVLGLGLELDVVDSGNNNKSGVTAEDMERTIAVKEMVSFNFVVVIFFLNFSRLILYEIFHL